MFQLLKIKLFFEKKKLEIIVKKYGITDDETLKQSHKLDKLINQYYRSIIKTY